MSIEFRFLGAASKEEFSIRAHLESSIESKREFWGTLFKVHRNGGIEKIRSFPLCVCCEENIYFCLMKKASEIRGAL